MKPTLFMMVGLPGAGKTTRAKEIEAEHTALRLTPDEWIVTIFGSEAGRPQADAVRDRVEGLLWQVACRVLELGRNVVVDYGFWTREERARYRRQAEAVGAQVQIVFVDAPLDVLWERIAQRPESGRGTLHITREELEYWATLFERPTEDELR